MVQVRSSIIFPQWYAGIGLMMLVLQLGIMSDWSTPTLAILLGPDSPIPMSLEEASWVASLLNFCRFLGAIVGCVSVIHLGTKHSIFVTLISIAVGWLGIAMADRLEHIYAARLFSGIGTGISFCAFPLFLGEVAEPHTRGVLLSLATLGAPVGMIVTCVISSYLSIVVIRVTASPGQGRRPQSREKIGNLFRSGKGVDAEMQAIEKFVTLSFRRQAQGVQETAYQKGDLPGRHPLQLHADLRTQQHAYVLGDYLDQRKVHSVQAIASGHLLDRAEHHLEHRLYFPDRQMWSQIFAVTREPRYQRVYARFDDSFSPAGRRCGCDRSAVYSIFLYTIAYCIGLMPVPSTILSELFPAANVKGIAASIASLTGAGMAFLATKTYQPMVYLRVSGLRDTLGSLGTVRPAIYDGNQGQEFAGDSEQTHEEVER
ncbi:hypothetical protein TSAR_004070 [Trichomalopsis sarcophagae]|uniref:Major facilitator superfamily (MFS) profile domain-containing protein n=1 Tax=Trichomalopsis sarcophagae TaxID=543379 RepID=A0A232EL83_9HYME|nr:hypothetical protein TSAR_004070 [Trichomalopsis sarcophagae]